MVENFRPTDARSSTVVCRARGSRRIEDVVNASRNGPLSSDSYPYALFFTISAWSSRKNVWLIPSGSKIFLLVNFRKDIPLTRFTIMAISV